MTTRPRSLEHPSPSEREGRGAIGELIDLIKKKRPLSRALAEESLIYNPDSGLIYRAAVELVGGRDKQMQVTQLRRLFAEVQTIARLGESAESEELPSGCKRRLVVRVQPFLAYAKGRGLLKEQAFSLLKTLLDPENFQKKGDVQALKEVFQALVGYAKYWEGARGGEG